MHRRDILKLPVLGLVLPATAAGRSLASPPGPGSSADAGPEFRPQSLHPDFETYAPGIEHFFLGNGEIQAVIQYCPDRSGSPAWTFIGLTLMDAERFARKWSTMLFHPERGLERTAVTVESGGIPYRARPETLVSIGWTYGAGIPTVSIVWTAGSLTVEERLFVPSEGRCLHRHILITGAAAAGAAVAMQLVPTGALFDEIASDPAQGRIRAEGFAGLQLYALEPGAVATGRYDLRVPAVAGAEGTAAVRFVYALSADAPDRSAPTIAGRESATRAYWAEKTLVSTGNAALDHLYAVSRTCMIAGTAQSGKRDSGIWMYNMEWVRDDLFTALAMLHTGFHREARTILERILRTSVGDDGRTIESSRWFGHEYTELDQNGEILYGLWSHLCWTGDESLVRAYWPRIRTVAEFPLQDFFRDRTTGLLHNKREFWERNDSFGVVDGYELAHQCWVALGLESIADVADRLGDGGPAGRWRAAAAELRRGLFEDPGFRFVEDGHLIKRRRRDGSWQRTMIPPSRRSMPPGSPIATEAEPECEPDTSETFPIIYGMVEPRSGLALGTMEWLERLWNQRWAQGGYPRYNVSSEPDLPGPWPITTAMMARAYVETGNSPMAWRALRWLRDVHGGASGWWFERYAPSITPPAPPVSVCGWIWPEILLLVVQNLMGIRPGLERLTIRPRLLVGLDEVSGVFRVRDARVAVRIRGARLGTARVNGAEVPLADGALSIAYPPAGSMTEIDM